MKNIIVILLLFFTALRMPVKAQASSDEPTILWLSSGVATVQTFRKLKATDTPIDTNNMLLNRLPHLKFNFQTVPSARMEKTMDTHQFVCATNRLKTLQRSKKYLYSQPLNLYLGFRLYSLKDNGTMPKQLLNSQQQLVSLKDMFEHFSERRLGVSRGRSFGQTLDAQIAALDPRNVIVHSGLGSLHSLLAMLLKKRVEYVLEFPVELSNSKLKSKMDVLLNSYEIAGSERYFVGHVTCKDNEKMRQVMAQINEQLNKMYTTDEFYLAHVNYLRKSDIEQFDKYFKQVFIPSKN